MNLRVLGSVCLTIVAFAAQDSLAQVPSAPPASPTVWSSLGIPQGIQKLKGAMINRRGKHPKLEPKAARKALADPANLASDVPVLKKAAEIKIAEDLKPQKIKAIRYLTSIGCGCYDTDGSITEALVAASDDCTEDVRLVTVESIAEAASGKCCANCGLQCCCKEAIVKRLAQMAYERDDTGCYLEPSQRVREAAARALRICCPSSAPVETLVEEPEAPPVVPREGAPAPKREGAPGEDAAGDDDVAHGSPAARHNTSRSRVAYLSEQPTKFTQETAGTPADFQGSIFHFDAQRQAAHVHLQSPTLQIPVGTIVDAYTQGPGELGYVGRLRVYEAFDGSMNVQVLTDGDWTAVPRRSLVFRASLPSTEPAVAPVVRRMVTLRNVSVTGSGVKAGREPSGRPAAVVTNGPIYDARWDLFESAD